MSTYYYLYCENCHRACPLGSRSAGSGGKIGGLAGDEWLRGFAVAHAGHCLVCTNEGDDERLDGAVHVDDEPNDDERALSFAEPRCADCDGDGLVLVDEGNPSLGCVVCARCSRGILP